MSSYKCPTAYKCISRHSEAVRTDSKGDVRRKYKRQQHRRESDGKRQRRGGGAGIGGESYNLPKERCTKQIIRK